MVGPEELHKIMTSRWAVGWSDLESDHVVVLDNEPGEAVLVSRDGYHELTEHVVELHNLHLKKETGSGAAWMVFTVVGIIVILAGLASFYMRATGTP